MISNWLKIIDQFPRSQFAKCLSVSFLKTYLFKYPPPQKIFFLLISQILSREICLSKNLYTLLTRSLIFLVYINDLQSELCYLPKIFVDDASLLSVVEDVNETVKN